MICKKCGSQLEDGNVFCGNCGTKVEDSIVDSSNNSPNNSASNNNLKNALIILIVCIIVGGLAVLCYTLLFNKKSSAGIIESAINNMFNMDSYKMNMNLNLRASEENEEVAVNMNADSNIDIKNSLATFNISVSTSGVTFEIPTYIDMASKNLYLKVPGEETWNKVSLTDYLDGISTDTSSKTKYVFEDYLRNDEFIEKIEKNKDVSQYRLHFTKEILNKLSEDEENDFDASALSELGLEDGFDIDVYVNTKGNYISKVVLDFSNREISDVMFNEFVLTIEFSNIGSVEPISIPSEVLSAEELDLDGMDDYDIPSYEDDEYVEDYKLTYDDIVLSYNLKEGYEASFVNSESFKIYRKNGMRVIMTIDYDTKDSFFENVLSEKENLEEEGCTDISLSDTKQLNYKDKVFNYQELKYKDEYGNDCCVIYLCYEIDSEYVYSVEYEDEENNGSINEEVMKDFLDIAIVNQ